MTNTLTISRGQFEAANPVPFGVFWSEPDSRYMTTMVHLNCLEYQGKWLGWQSAILAAPAVERQDVLPCDVRVAPATTIRKGCKIETLMQCIQLREGRPDRDCQFRDSPLAPVAVPEGMLLVSRGFVERVNKQSWYYDLELNNQSYAYLKVKEMNQ